MGVIMTKMTQKQLHDDIANAFASGSVTQLSSALGRATHTQLASLGKSQKWVRAVCKNSSQLTPHKAYLFANTMFKQYDTTDMFYVFLENCTPVHTYLKGLKIGEKPSVISSVQQWVRESALHNVKTFELLNTLVNADVALMSPSSFSDVNDIWWPTLKPNVMQSIAHWQPNFVKQLQNVLIENLPNVAQLITALYPVATVPTKDQKDAISKAVSTALGGGRRPYLYALMRDHLQEILFQSSEENDVSQNIALCVIQGEMYTSLIALQTWNNYIPLTHTQLQKVHEVMLTLNDLREKIATYSTTHATDFLNICQAAHIQNQLGDLPQPAIRKM